MVEVDLGKQRRVYELSAAEKSASRQLLLNKTQGARKFSGPALFSCLMSLSALTNWT